MYNARLPKNARTHQTSLHWRRFIHLGEIDWVLGFDGMSPCLKVLGRYQLNTHPVVLDACPHTVFFRYAAIESSKGEIATDNVCPDSTSLSKFPVSARKGTRLKCWVAAMVTGVWGRRTFAMFKEINSWEDCSGQTIHVTVLKYGKTKSF